jgi:L-aspartate oxidase
VIGRLTAPSPGWTVDADVVVIGSGIAGLTAALRLRGVVGKVLVVTKDVLVRLSAGRATREASGRLTLEHAREVAETRVDVIWVGALTHSARVFDPGLDLHPTEPLAALALPRGPRR